MEQAIIELINLAEKTAPELWRIALNQVSITGKLYVFYFAVFLTITFRLLWLVKFFHLRDLMYPHNGHDGAMKFAIAFSVIAAIIMFTCATYALMYLSNPEYYAIKVLVGLVK